MLVKYFRIFLIVALVFLFVQQSQGERAIRAVGGIGGIPTYIEENVILQDMDTLFYEDPRNLPYFWTIPNDWGDIYPNVRFTPTFAPFRLLQVHIPLFDVFEQMGEPNMRIIIWQSANGNPGEAIDSIYVPFEDLVFTSGDDPPAFNVINVSELDISFNDVMDFHIGVDLVSDNDGDTLAIYFDDGRFSQTTRSYIMLTDGEEPEWFLLTDVDGIELPYNFAIRCVIASLEALPPTEFDLLYPADHQVVRGPAVNFQWQRSQNINDDEPIEYRLDLEVNLDIFHYYTQDPSYLVDFSELDVDINWMYLNESKWNVTAISDYGATPSSSERRFMLMHPDNVELDEQMPIHFGLQNIYPNPFNVMTNVSFTSDKETYASLIVYDLMGIEVVSLHQGNVSVGEHSFTWDATEHPAGVYLVRLSSEGNTQISKVVLLK